MSLKPDAADTDALFKRASALHLQGRLAEAAEIYNKLLARFPRNSKLLNNLGNIAIQTGNIQQGLILLQRSLRIDPCQAAALFNLGNGLRQLGRLQEALASYERSLALQPDQAQAHFNRGLVLESLRNHEQALASCDHAISLSPTKPVFHNTRGNQLVCLGRADEALASYDRAIALKEDYVEAHCNRGLLLQYLNRLDEALACFDLAIKLNPDFPYAYLDKSLLKLAMGDYEQGWALYEWRWKCAAPLYVRRFLEPLWLGEQKLEGKTLMVYAEAGLGDVIQFCRFLPMMEALGAKVVFEVPVSLVALMKTLSKCHVTVIPKGQPLPAFDLQCPIMSLPLAFKTTMETLPAKVPYLRGNEGKTNEWRHRLGSKKIARIGLAWSGRAGAEIDFNSCRRRSIPFQFLAPLLQLPIEFHCLQKEIRPEDTAGLTAFSQLHLHQDELHDFSDTAALIGEMDMVITIDTSVAHLAGALGKPMWVLLPFATDFRWTLKETTTPWYPTATLFRQQVIGDWPSVVTEVVARLGQRNILAV